MKLIAVFWLSFALVLPWMAMAQDKVEPPTFEKKAEPEYPADLKVFVVEPAQVELVIDEQGVPYSLRSLTSLPDNVVQAISKWRFHPARKNGMTVGYRFGFVLPIHRSVGKIAWQRSQRRATAKDIGEAFATARNLDAGSAARMEQQLSPKSDSVSAHLTLLAFSSAGTEDATIQMRLRQILWLTLSHPEHDILAAPYATLTLPPPADSSSFDEIRQDWMEQLARNPADPVVLDHASNILRLTNPELVEHTILPVVGKADGAAVFLGDLYGLSALGATAVDGEPSRISGASEQVARTPFAVHVRDALDKTTDLRVLIPALATIIGAGRPLATAGHIPDGYMELCGRLLARVREADPEVEDQCVAEPKPSKVEPAKLLRSEPLIYPQDARSRRIEGTVVLKATIGKDGRTEDPELLSGPLALYDAARESVMKWKYQPTRLDGVAVTVSTTLEVNFVLRH